MEAFATSTGFWGAIRSRIAAVRTGSPGYSEGSNNLPVTHWPGRADAAAWRSRSTTAPKSGFTGGEQSSQESKITVLHRCMCGSIRPGKATWSPSFSISVSGPRRPAISSGDPSASTRPFGRATRAISSSPRSQLARLRSP